MTADDVEDLREILLEAVKKHEASLDLKDQYGQRYHVDFLRRWQGRQAKIRSAWIIESDVESPRLTSCYILRD